LAVLFLKREAPLISKNPIKMCAAIIVAVFLPVAVCAQEADTRAGRLQQQRQDKSRALRPYERTGLESVLYEFKERRILERYQAGYRGFHPILGGMTTGSGFAFGTQFRKNDIANGILDLKVGGQASLAGYQKYQLGVSAPRLAKGRVFVGFDFTQDNYPQEDFFGVGSDASKQDRTNYRLEQTDYSTRVGVRPVRQLEVGGRFGILNTNVGRGTDVRFPSVEEVFDAGAAPALDRQPHYTYAGGFARYDRRDHPGNPRTGSLFEVEYTHYHDRKLDLYGFRRWRMEVQQYVPFFNARRVIAFRGKVDLTSANEDQLMPFFMMPTVGGSEDLRGYPEFRFRDKNSAVFNLEYRWEAFSGLDLALFGDAGNVFREGDDISLRKLKTAYGFGFRFNNSQSVFWRIDFGFSPESQRTFVKFNHVF
jgi:outer membrane protein assembly factor BamA